MSVPAEHFQPHRRADFVRNIDRIIDGATAALADDPGASMSEIAAASGLARATLYRHFSDRDELLKAIYRSGLERAGEAIEAAEPERGPAPRALRRVIDGLWEVSDRYRIITEQQLTYPDLMFAAEAAFSPFIELVERGQREGTIRKGLPARWLVASSAALLTEAIRAVGRGELTPEKAPATVAATILEPVEASS